MVKNPGSAIKLTSQRQWVLDCICQQPHHLDADHIYKIAKSGNHPISLATIYRALAYLKSAGLIEEHKLGSDHSHFEPAEPKPHYHFTCQQCGKVIEFELPALNKNIQQLAAQLGFSVNSTQLLVNGTCQDCRGQHG